jgi:hypothetical protein
VKGDQVEERALDVLKDVPPLADGGHNRCEVVVEENEIRRATGYVSAAPTHGDADVGPMQGGRVVDAVAGHGDDGAGALQAVDDEEFLFGADPRKDRSAVDPRGAFGLVERRQLVSRDDQSSRAGCRQPRPACAVTRDRR